MLQFAIQQSLMDPGTENEQVTFYEALNRDKTPGGSVHSGLSGYVNIASEEERQLQRYVQKLNALEKDWWVGPCQSFFWNDTNCRFVIWNLQP